MKKRKASKPVRTPRAPVVEESEVNIRLQVTHRPGVDPLGVGGPIEQLLRDLLDRNRLGCRGTGVCRVVSAKALCATYEDWLDVTER